LESKVYPYVIKDTALKKAYPIACLASSTTAISSLRSEPDEKQSGLLFIPVTVRR